jgi:hypothetical protein
MLHHTKGHLDGLQYKHVFQNSVVPNVQSTLGKPANVLKMHIFKNVLFATRKPQDVVNEEIVRQAKIILKLVTTVLQSPTPHCPQANFECRGTNASVKIP